MIQFDYWNTAILQTSMLPDDIRVQIWDVTYLGQTKKPVKKMQRQITAVLETKHGQMLLKRLNRLITRINYVKYNFKFNICNGMVKKKLLLVKIFVFVRNIN